MVKYQLSQELKDRVLSYTNKSVLKSNLITITISKVNINVTFEFLNYPYQYLVH